RPCCKYFSRSISTIPLIFKLVTRLAPAQGPNDSTSRRIPWTGGLKSRSLLRWSFCSTKSISLSPSSSIEGVWDAVAAGSWGGVVVPVDGVVDDGFVFVFMFGFDVKDKFWRRVRWRSTAF